MKFSLITVSYNSVSTIEETIKSVLNQSYKNIEYIVIDGSSTDGTQDVINKYKNNISKVVIEPDHGIYDAMNKGIQVATGEIIGILNSDDVYKNENIIENIFKEIDADVSADAYLTDIAFFEGTISSPKLLRVVRAKNFEPWKLRFGWMPPHPGMFIRKEVFKNIGNYDLSFTIASDYEFCIRAFCKAKMKFKSLDLRSVYMREGGVSTRNFKSNVIISKEIMKACKKNLFYTNYLFVLSRLPFKLLSKYIDKIRLK